jgi:hypothetical protein
MQSDLGLNIREAHAFNTSDGFSLDVFVVGLRVAVITWSRVEPALGGGGTPTPLCTKD